MSDKSVKVALRIRPLVTTEMQKGCKNIFDTYPELGQVRIRDMDKAFSYNYVFDFDAPQSDVYTTSVKPMLHQLFSGYNLTILAYGQTGSGKTHTMGTMYSHEDLDLGVIPRAVEEIFTHVKNDSANEFSINVSFMELYQETLYDLLATKSREQCVLDIREDANKEIVIPGLTTIPVQDMESVLAALMRGSKSRVTGATNMNAQSSRSHAIFTMNVNIKSRTDGSERSAKFHFVDLAGSERPKKTGAVGTTFKEGVNINKGLLVLGNVISALGDDKQQHNFIPYRDSNLTRLLKDSLGGNSITLMIACVSPADYNLEETVSTLRYADRARKIQNKPIVNQDPKAAEINFLKKTIQQLKLQIIGQGGPVLSSEDLTHLKEENLQLQLRIRDLTLRLSSTLNDNTSLIEKIMILQTANENLNKKIQALKHEYDATVDSINVSFTKNDCDAMKRNLTKLQHIQERLEDIDAEQKKTEDEIRNHEDIVDLHNSRNSDLKRDESSIMSQDQENYTNKQMALNNELQDIMKKLAIKEHLAKQITTNTHDLVDYNAMAETEAKITALEREKDELVQQLKNVTHGPSGKLAEQRKKRVQDLEKEIQDLNKKVQEQARLIKLKEKDVKKVNQLNSEILLMKQTRVKLIRKMREESEQFRSWKIQRERELAKLKQQDRKKQNQIVKMEVMHSKQQNVLKRKVEEAVALNKRLKEALTLRKAVHDNKHHEKTEKLGHWIKQEFDVHMHLVEAEATLAGLMEDRATLKEQLDKLRDSPDADQSQIQSIEEDIELRSVQIQGLQQKIIDSDEDNKKSKLDNIQTMAEAKFALKTIMEQATEMKKNEVTAKNKLMEAQACSNEVKHKADNLEKVVKVLEYKHGDEVARLQNDYEEKIAVLLRQLRGKEFGDVDEELKQRCKIQSDKIEKLDQMNQELMEKLYETQRQVDELQTKFETITLAQKADMNGNASSDVVTPTPMSKRCKVKYNTVDSTFVIENEQNLNVTAEDLDDITRDPDWTNTPIGKWIMGRKKRVTANSQSVLESDNNVTLKRTSDGGCMCVKSHCTLRCGCKKINKRCSASCRCSNTTCRNRDDVERNESNRSADEKRPRLRIKYEDD